MQQIKHLVKKAKGPWRWPRFSQINYTQWPLWFTINQISHYDSMLSQINHTNLTI